MFSMRWPIILLIFRREVRDQLRDRRTLFMIVVLPVLLYPTLGLVTVRLSMAFEQRPRRVVIAGAEALPAEPALLNRSRDGFAPDLFERPDEARRYRVEPVLAGSPWSAPAYREAALRRGEMDAVLLVPADLRARIADESRSAEIPIRYSGADEPSIDTYRSVDNLIERWNRRIVEGRLRRDRKPESYLQAVEAGAEDVARVKGATGNVWARLFPFLLVMMSLTGAFYPAVDLCAGEKERGTMETLLITPSTRPEIVTGKFLIVMLAGMATALVNLASMGRPPGNWPARSAPAIGGPRRPSARPGRCRWPGCSCC